MVIAEQKPDMSATMTVGNTTFIVNSFFNGKETLNDILKRLILRDLERADG